MASVATIRLCPACNTGYIMRYDLHAICEGCLGPDHASLALTPQSTCPSCRCLPLEDVLPDIIAKVAEAKGVPVPVSFAQLPTDDLAGKFAPAHLTRRDPVWSRFPAVTAYLSGAAAEPLQLKAPVSTFTPITRVESLTDQGFPQFLLWSPVCRQFLGLVRPGASDDGLCPPPPVIRSWPG
ncbi:hypothetical protein GOODEAATRI_023333 [Goodea atripinnis]|uniref:Uncharacterized protein n=1 Tax=Goodea atripinnis TaxID=208336 RepID=A0ABV0PGE0_9TELE